jgi:hypothetical protein
MDKFQEANKQIMCELEHDLLIVSESQTFTKSKCCIDNMTLPV